MNGYDLSRLWFDFCFENPEKVKPNHCAIYFFAIEHCNRLGWKDKFGLPSSMTMEAIGIKSYNTYIKSLNDLVDWGFIKMVEKSKNQYSSNIIALSEFNKALDKALDKAFIKHASKQSESTGESIDSIDKQITNKPFNHLTNKPIIEKKFDFKKSLIDFGFSKNLIDDWLLIRKNKKATNSKTAFDLFIGQVEKANRGPDEILKICIEKDWKGFQAEWLKNLENQNQNGNSTSNQGRINTNQGYKPAAIDSEKLVQQLTDDLENGDIPGQY